MTIQNPLALAAATVLIAQSCLHGANVLEDVRTVAIRGAAAPSRGTDAYVFSSYLSLPVINNAGQVAFSGDLYRIDSLTGTRRAVLTEGGGDGLRLAALAKEQAPGDAAGVAFSTFYETSLSDAGQTTFTGLLRNFESFEGFGVGIWTEQQGELRPVVRTGDVLPSIERRFESEDVSISGSFGPQVNGLGQVAVKSTLASGGTVILSEAGGNGLSAVVRDGDPAPGTKEEARFFRVGGAYSNDGASLVVEAQLDETASFDQGIWSDTGGGMRLVARQGDQPPQTEPGESYRRLMGATINNRGQTAFLAWVTKVDAEPYIDYAIFRELEPGDLHLLARSGSAALPLDADVNFGELEQPLLNDRGQAVFKGALVGTGVDETNGSGIWRDSVEDGLSLVVRTGDQAPDLDEGVAFHLLADPLLNERGHIAFVASLRGPNIDHTNDYAIFAEDPIGDLRLVAREGDVIDVSSDPHTPDIRTLRTLGRAGGREGELTNDIVGTLGAFNDLGQLAFLTTFTDGAPGIFVSNRVAVPEPATLVLLASCLAPVAYCVRLARTATL
ncbi:MAG: hypothetical protein KDA61_07335 [Planctomycetales bacterium]|nr:hypothetical protein [Planctomycetales bacterium]